MNILLIHQFLLEKDEGGGSRFNEMTRIWAEQGHRITVLAGMVHYATGKKPQKYRGKFTCVDTHAENIRVIRCHVSEAYHTGFLGRLWAYVSFVVSSLYAGLFRARGRFDVILATSPPLFVGITAYLLSLLKRTPLVFEVRDLWPESAIDTGVLTNRALIRLAYGFERFIYRKSRLINVLTPAFRDRLLAKGVPPEKIILVPNAADFSVVEESLSGFDREVFRRRKGWNGKTVILYVGAHGVANHLIQIVDAAEALRDHPEVLFVLLGDGPEKPMLREAVRDRRLVNVQFLDSVSKKEVFRYISASDFGASVLKRVDTFKTVYSNKTFDYMACKRPVLMVIDGASRQLVEDAHCGCFVEPESREDFSKKVRAYLAADRREWVRQGEAGCRYAHARFDRSVLAQTYLRHLERCA